MKNNYDSNKPLTSERPKQTLKTNYVESRSKHKLTDKETRILEQEVEQYLVRRAKQCGLEILKLNPQGAKGIPDRLVFHPNGIHGPQFVELKRDFQAKASPLQKHYAKGLNTIFLHSKEEVEYFLHHYFIQSYVPSKAPMVE